MLARVTIFLGILCAAGPAFALKPAKHADIAQKSCVAAGLPSNLCHRIATEDYNTDGNEWDDLRAHAQIEVGKTACDSAQGAAGRMWSLGHDLRAQLAKFAASGTYDDAGEVGALIGRAMHTIQDDCAHHGMPNPQHAWFSLGDFCEGTSTSPDVQDDAIACARTETDAAMKIVAAEIKSSGLARSLDNYSCPPAPNTGPHDNTQQQAICDRRWLPTPFEACDFLGEAKGWDGIDRTWNNAVVAPALRAALADGIAGRGEPASICNGDEGVLSNATSQQTVDVSQGAPGCFQSSLFCLGKADDDSANPFADDPVEQAGCSAGGGRADVLGVVFALGLVLRRRRRR